MLILIYIIVGVLWGLFASTMEKEHYPYASTFLITITGIINAVFWPIAMIIAYNRQ